MRRRKYRNVRTAVDGVVVDSKREAGRLKALRLLERAGKITALRTQVRYELIPAQRVNGRVVERAVCYVADFVYLEDGRTIVEDAKGMRTRDYVIKRKLMLWVHRIRIREV